MSKAEERALEAYPVFMTTLIPADDEHPLIEQDCNKFTREAYIKGYCQAEKDLKLTIEDIKKIHTFLYAIKNNKQGAFTFTRLSDEKYQEVLKRFKDLKHVK